MKRSIYLRAILLTVLVVFMGFVSAPRAEAAANPNGAGGQMPAFFNGQQFTINFKEQPSEGVLLQRNQVNTIYMCDQCAAQGHDFVSVIDEIQGKGFNPLWNEVQVVFNPGHPFQQFTSASAILAAAASGVITLKLTPDVYRCSVVGPGPK